MATKNHRQGGKFGGNHTTLIDLAVILVDIAEPHPEVTMISPGFINSNQGGGNERRVKIIDTLGGILLAIRQSSSTQEVRIVTKNPQVTKLAIAKGARDHKIAISFGRKEEINSRLIALRRER